MSRVARSAKLSRSNSARLNASSSLEMDSSLLRASSCDFWNRPPRPPSSCSWDLMRSSNTLCPHTNLLSALSSAAASLPDPCSKEARRSRSGLTSSEIRCSNITRISSSRAACWAVRPCCSRACCSAPSRCEASSAASFWTSVATSCRQRGRVLLVSSALVEARSSTARSTPSSLGLRAASRPSTAFCRLSSNAEARSSSCFLKAS
mmetsp:Transcript_58681/g.182269  ORF Transcript_58681/g.182269 Transcript_58681/m.182269 type:complete len:206 (+) Transcript_58681:1147-1764(+)